MATLMVSVCISWLLPEQRGPKLVQPPVLGGGVGGVGGVGEVGQAVRVTALEEPLEQPLALQVAE